MTLKQKLDIIKGYDEQDPYKTFMTIAEELAIEFNNWMRKNDTSENSEKYFHYTDKDMFNVFKEENEL